MPVPDKPNAWLKNGDGGTTLFPYDNKIFAATDMKVFLGPDGARVEQTLNTHYTVTGVGEDGGGNVAFVAPPPVGVENVYYFRKVPDTQETKFPESNPIPSGSLTKGLDKLTVLVQQLSARLARALVLAEDDPDATIGALPRRAARLGKVLHFNAATGAPEALSPAAAGFGTPTIAPGDAGKLVGVDAAETGLEVKSAADARTAIGATTTGAAVITAADAAAARDAMGLVIGDDVLAPDGDGAGLTGLLAQGEHTVWVPAAAMTARTTNGAADGSAETTTNKVMIVTKDFDASTEEYVQFGIRMPKSWNEGTVTFVPVWSHPATTTNFGVVWEMQGVAISDDDALDAAFGTAIASTDTGGTTDDLYQGPESAAVTIGGTPAAGDYVVFQVGRKVADAADTMAVDARLHGIVLLMTLDAKDDS